MPELPEVETMRRGLLAAVGETVEDVRQPPSRYRPIVIEPALPELRKRLKGRRIIEVDRLGKRVVIVLDSTDRLVIQPKMAGLLLIGTPPNPSHVRLILDLVGDASSPVVYWDQRGLGSIRLYRQQEYEAYLATGVIGPDALQIGFEDFYRRLASSHREVKPTLLDQARVAGIGNLYASEILHHCRIHPQIRADQVGRSGWKKIYEATRKILELAIEYEGSTLSDGSYRTAKNDPGRFQNAHRVYDRAGLDCLNCGRGKIVRIVQAQRSTFLCPCCQRRKGKS